MRNMSFQLKTQQMYARSATVTRRFGWRNIKPGDLIQAIERGQGLKLGEKVVKICIIEIVSTRWEPLDAITKEDCILEGFPHLTPNEFVRMLADP